MLELMLASTIGFYLAIIAISVVIMALEETEHEVLALFAVVILFAYARWAGGFDLFAYATTKPISLVLWTVSYFLVGAISLWPKWYGFISDFVDAEVERQSTFRERRLIVAPVPSKYKERIISWAVYWPWSMFWFLVRHPLRRVGKFIYESMEGSLEWISRKLETRAQAKLDSIKVPESRWTKR